MSEDPSVRDVVDHLAPPESPAFFDEFWERVRLDERSRRRRRRRVTVSALAALGMSTAVAAALGAPSLFFATKSVLDRTYSCAVPSKTTASGDVRAMNLNANVAHEYYNPVPQSDVTVFTVFNKKAANGFTVPQLEFSSLKNSFRVDGSLCRRSSRAVPLKAAGLEPQGTITRDLNGHFGDQCITSARVVVRVRLETSDGVPTRGQLAIRDDNTKAAPIAFVNWKPTRISYALRPTCTSYS
jgi:hypothetical protein